MYSNSDAGLAGTPRSVCAGRDSLERTGFNPREDHSFHFFPSAPFFIVKYSTRCMLRLLLHSKSTVYTILELSNSG